MAVQVTIDPDVSLVLLFYRLHKFFDGAHLWMKDLLWVNPLTVQVHARQRVAVVATDYAVRIHNGNEDEGVEPTEVLGLRVL